MTQPQTLQQGRYVLRGVLGDDACGVVYLAQDTKIAQRDVAIRKLADAAVQSATLQRIAQLNHPALPSVYDVFEEAGFRYIVLEHPQGQTLADIALGPRIKEAVVVAWAKHAAAALSYLHRQSPPIVHGDVRPANIVLHNGKQIKLINGTPSGCGVVPASRYTAPEILSVAGTPPTIAADVYAFGATLHHILTGIDPNTQPLMSFAPPDVRRPDLSSGLNAAIVRALNADPKQRFASINELIDAITSTASGQSSSDLPAIGFTPSYPVVPADGPTQRYMPSAEMPIPVPSSRMTANEPAYDPYQTAQQSWQTPPPAAPVLPTRPESDGGRLGYIALGVLLLLLLLGGGFWLLNRNTASPNPRTSVIAGLPTVTRDEGRLLTDGDRTATALALIPPPPGATQIPTVDAPRLTAEALQTFTAATSAAFDNDIEAIYQRALGYENTGQLGLALSDYDEVLRRRPDYKDAQQRRDRVQEQLNATTVAGGIQGTAQAATSQAVVDATATAGALPTPTATLPPPTATPVGQVIGDGFDSTTLDPARWASAAQGGTIVLADGALQLAARNATCFPTVRTMTDTAFPQANFDLTVTFRYSDVTPLGSGFMLSDAMPDLCSNADRAGTAWGGIWQDSQQGLMVEFHRDAGTAGDLKDIRLAYSQGQIDMGEHTFTLQRRNQRDTYILDGNVLFEEAAGAAPTVLWFGNPGQSQAAGDWTVINILNVDVRQQP